MRNPTRSESISFTNSSSSARQLRKKSLPPRNSSQHFNRAESRRPRSLHWEEVVVPVVLEAFLPNGVVVVRQRLFAFHSQAGRNTPTRYCSRTRPPS